MLIEILPNSSKIWSACQSYFNYRRYGEYLMNQADWDGLIRCLLRDQNVWRQQQMKERCCFMADVDAYPSTLAPFPGWRAEGSGSDPRFLCGLSLFSPFLHIPLHCSVPALPVGVLTVVCSSIWAHWWIRLHLPDTRYSLVSLHLRVINAMLFPSLEQMFEMAKNIFPFHTPPPPPL